MRSEPDDSDRFSFDGPEIMGCTARQIDWEKGKNVTLTTVEKQQKHKACGTVRTVTQCRLACPSRSCRAGVWVTMPTPSLLHKVVTTYMNVRSQDQRYASLEKPLNYDEGGQKRMRRKRRRKTTQIVTPRHTDSQRSATRAPTARHKGRPRQPCGSAFPCRLAALRRKGRCFGSGSFYLAFELQCSCQKCRRQTFSHVPIHCHGSVLPESFYHVTMRSQL